MVRRHQLGGPPAEAGSFLYVMVPVVTPMADPPWKNCTVYVPAAVGQDTEPTPFGLPRPVGAS